MTPLLLFELELEHAIAKPSIANTAKPRIHSLRSLMATPRPSDPTAAIVFKVVCIGR
jgi:hypothetical protein